MKDTVRKRRLFPSAHEDAKAARLYMDSLQSLSPSYKLAYQDEDFLLRDELRPVRLQLELLKPELVQQEHNIETTVVIYGSARIPDPERAREDLERIEKEAQETGDTPDIRTKMAKARNVVKRSRYYEEASKLGHLISVNTEEDKLVVVTGGGPGIMEAANRGAYESGCQSIGMNIVLPFEQQPNPYVTPELSFQFHYFAIRKMHLLMRAKSLVAFPGGFGTMDELFETLTLIQTRKIKPIPVLLFGKDFWEKIINFRALVEEGVVAEKDLNIFQFVETAEDAWGIIAKANGV
jgi:uncharacterized protein (TIGR00730 family)